MRSLTVSILVLTAAAALVACAKSSGSTEASVSSAVPTTAPAVKTGSHGAKVFQTNCSSCHQADGKGVSGAFPPLAGNPLVVSDPKFVIHIVKYGLTGKIAVQGRDFNGIMPPWGTQLSNGDIADVITYIRSSWGNHAPPVTAAEVAAVAK
ncbi:MAG TPA: cytochrome c [Candidatus Tumulicola sp.]|jgi:mono/diheme cytochrome c family protein